MPVCIGIKELNRVSVVVTMLGLQILTLLTPVRWGGYVPTANLAVSKQVAKPAEDTIEDREKSNTR